MDGFTDPTGSGGGRYSLGQITSVSRNSTIEITRKFIGKGLKLIYINGDVIVECLGDVPIFVNSRISNIEHRFDKSTVCKVLPGYYLKIFDNRLFADLLVQSVENGFEATMKLVDLCSMRISFAKGWGTRYKRKDVTSTPCWIEVSVNGPLKWLDKVLVAFGTFDGVCGSNT